MNQKLGFLCFRGIHNSLPLFCAKLGYSQIKIDHIADSLLKLHIEIGVHLVSVELSQLLTLFWSLSSHNHEPYHLERRKKNNIKKQSINALSILESSLNILTIVRQYNRRERDYLNAIWLTMHRW